MHTHIGDYGNSRGDEIRGQELPHASWTSGMTHLWKKTYIREKNLTFVE